MTTLTEQATAVQTGVPPPDPRMEKAMQALKGLPPFSATLSRLMASLAGDDVSFSELGDLIEKDTVVSGNILGMVNSALYSRRGAVTSVRHGLSLLGTNRIRNLVLSLQVSGLWSNARCPQELSIARFNQHAAAVAMLSDFLAQHAQVDYPEGAFLGGLLHDVGQLILVLGLPADFRQILAVHRQTGTPLEQCESAHLSFNHATLSACALATWKIAEPIRRAVEQHHDAEIAQECGALSLGRIIAVADRFANSVGLSTFPSASQQDPDYGAIASLGFSEEKTIRLAQDFLAEFEATAKFYR